MKIIFLDVDGVLNTGRYRKLLRKVEHMNSDDSQFFFDPIAMRNLSKIVNENDAKIVISSTWRYDRHKDKDIYWNMLMGNLRQFNLDERVIDVTPDLRHKYNTISCRGYEIKDWLNNSKEIIDGFVIIDDDSNMGPLMNKLAYCDDFYGFNKECFNVATKIINNIELKDEENSLIQRELI